MRQVLARLEITSNGPISSYSPVASKGGFSSGEPTTGDTRPPHIFWARRYNACIDDAEREHAIASAARELDEITQRVYPAVEGESIEDRNTRMVKDYAGWSAMDVATAFRCGVREVHKARLAAGRDKDYGQVVEQPTGKRLAADERRRKVHDLKARHPGMTARQIAMHVGASHPTVVEDLKRDAA